MAEPQIYCGALSILWSPSWTLVFLSVL
jgi:hypothetical protein